MDFGGIHSGHQGSARRASPLPSVRASFGPSRDVSATSASCLCVLCVSAPSLNFRLLTANLASFAQPPCFHNLPHSFMKSQKSPLCFHNLTNCFSPNSFFFTTLQNARGCTPPSTNSFHFNRATATLRSCTHATTKSKLAARVRAVLAARAEKPVRVRPQSWRAAPAEIGCGLYFQPA
jgi:hypothetical protein